MFKFRFILDYFRTQDALGPIIENSLRAKWLTKLCPNDIELAFAPNEGQKPLYEPEKVRIVSKTEPNWWNHYSFNSFQTDPKEKNFSLGPNLYLNQRPETTIPLVVYSQWQKGIVLNKWNQYPEQYIKVIPNMVDYSLFKVGEKSKHINGGLDW
ncbi:hypothetical protein [Lysinibacillus sp. SGAir0095]|uniref:hypothetical protein n=1 Tax=Lysinibacillus sp. SGAir0095 TaxID=2070463 RepID=UPI0010CCE2F1|nr:hypothetical protein [Lysinibacillus sp. SGAir0095]QCR33957.1 hypothetical protein C1N55_18285 [Lysinibacillus sp. SGAir0095]